MTTATLARPQERRTCAPCTLDAARAHRRAHVPDTVRARLICTSALTQGPRAAHEHAKIRRELARIHTDVAGMRDDLDETRAAARYEAAFAEMESLVYLHAALDPDITEADVLVRAAWALHLGAHDGIAGPDEALRLALATLRGWTHRQALAAGGAR